MYRDLALLYKLTYNQIARMNPFQQMSMLKIGPNEANLLRFDSMDAYMSWASLRDKK